MLVELVRTKTSDGLRLDGSLAEAKTPDTNSNAVDAVILLHGVGGSFFSGAMFDPLTRRMLDLGISALRVNTRGYGSINMIATDGGATRGGAAYEVVDQCRYDISAWCDFLVSRGWARIGLVGHSLGAIKAIYAAAHAPHKHIVRVVAASPPRLSYSAFQHGPRVHDFLESMSTAKQQVKQGHPEQLITVKFPFPMVISAASYVDKYGGERYNFTNFFTQIRSPLLFTYGSIELEQGGIAFTGLPETIQKASTEAVDFDATNASVLTIDGADHFYTGKYDKLTSVVSNWLAKA